MFVTAANELSGPRWIINFPTKRHWRQPSRIEWIEEGLLDLVRVVREKGIRSLALPPLGCGNGGLDWRDVRPLIEAALTKLDGVEVVAFAPTEKYQNVAKPMRSISIWTKPPPPRVRRFRRASFSIIMPKEKWSGLKCFISPNGSRLKC